MAMRSISSISPPTNGAKSKLRRAATVYTSVACELSALMPRSRGSKPFASSMAGLLKNDCAKDSTNVTFPALSRPVCSSETSEWPRRNAAVENFLGHLRRDRWVVAAVRPYRIANQYRQKFFVDDVLIFSSCYRPRHVIELLSAPIGM